MKLVLIWQDGIMKVNQSQRAELEMLLDKVVNSNGGLFEVLGYYKDQNLKDEVLYKDLYMQIPPLDRQKFAQSFTLDAINIDQLTPTIKSIIEAWI